MKYEIFGNSFPALICQLEKGEAMITEGGGMSWMSPCIKMETVGGGIGKVFGRAFSGESLFQNRYTALENGSIAFASSLPGEIMPLELSNGRQYICQKSAFLASTTDVDLSIAFQKKLGSGFFGGEGFIMQRISGTGIAFIEIDGAAIRYNLQPGEQLIVDTGHLVMMDSTCKMDVQMVKGVKNVLFGGEGLFNTVVTGPGEVVIQTMPIMKLAGSIGRYITVSK